MKLNQNHLKLKLHNLEIIAKSLALFSPKVPKNFIVCTILATDNTARVHMLTELSENLIFYQNWHLLIGQSHQMTLDGNFKSVHLLF